MHIETLEKAIQRDPFIPFEVQTAAGQIYRAHHHDQVWLTPRRRVLVMAEMDTDAVELISVSHISAIKTLMPDSD